jgi:hypothetical protein
MEGYDQESLNEEEIMNSYKNPNSNNDNTQNN